MTLILQVALTARVPVQVVLAMAKSPVVEGTIPLRMTPSSFVNTKVLGELVVPTSRFANVKLAGITFDPVRWNIVGTSLVVP